MQDTEASIWDGPDTFTSNQIKSTPTKRKTLKKDFNKNLFRTYLDRASADDALLWQESTEFYPTTEQANSYKKMQQWWPSPKRCINKYFCTLSDLDAQTIMEIGASIAANGPEEKIDCTGLFIYPGMALKRLRDLELAELSSRWPSTVDFSSRLNFTPNMQALTASEILTLKLFLSLEFRGWLGVARFLQEVYFQVLLHSLMWMVPHLSDVGRVSQDSSDELP